MNMEEQSVRKPQVAGRISVIMPCYNAERHLRESIDCVLNQSYPDVELVVVDDGSTDGSREILAEYGDRIVFVEQENQGPYPARNNGMTRASGEFVAFLDADDYWAADCLEKLHAGLVGSDAALAYCGWQNVGLAEKSGEPYIPPVYSPENKAEMFLRSASPWPIHAALVRRDVMIEVGGFDLNWSTCMDYDLWLRIAVARPIVLVEEVLAFYRHHGVGQITSNEWRQARNVRDVKKKFVANHPELVVHLSAGRLRELIDGALLKRAYNAYWRRDLVSAQKIFRMVFPMRCWQLKDLRYILPALLLPEALYPRFIAALDRRGG
ncbi:hypothetical protein Tel_13575 [Candidatus Tenderia electrophaga]|jgi:glycosyltransferase involved in cell wall biosynthesis|uniref:Glycosyltransferase 2-like domain-containing protein n=1 Tax=Candidatus Tenderia electrophaga TaxID=1748243 RepID=A0A0S2TG07_9GAMM|nr:hypothetical protein Tel_13575 [Candidatus Tenderia electrophaga]